MSGSTGTSPFEDAVGAAHVTEAAPTDAIDGVMPRWVVETATAAEVAVVMKIAHDHGLSVVARGLGRHLTLGNAPRTVDVVLSLSRMNRVLSYEPADMTVQVEAGCSLLALGVVLFESSQWLPLDPPFVPQTTVGGLLATNLTGPLRASQGSARDLLIGIRTVAPDGTIVAGGGRVVKNVAGYDLPKMHIGALGTLGIIVEATFKVRPRPHEERALEITCKDPAEAATMALEMRDACEPFWLHLGNQGDAAWTIVAGAGGRSEEVTAALASYRRIAEARGATMRDVSNAAETRHHLADSSAEADRNVLRISTLPTRVGARLVSLEAAATRLGAAPAFHCDIACGIIRMSIDAAAHLADLVAEARPTIERDGGCLVVERANAADKQTLSEIGGVWGDAGSGLPLMRGLKEAFDPTALLSPGRFVGGI
ncbi:MAG: FAD-binding oxidoreductase [Candidatus Binatia bacterium]|nr:FAD-binding oxidoreductase [Candidatus Binatia bacterium]